MHILLKILWIFIFLLIFNHPLKIMNIYGLSWYDVLALFARGIQNLLRSNFRSDDKLLQIFLLNSDWFVVTSILISHKIKSFFFFIRSILIYIINLFGLILFLYFLYAFLVIHALLRSRIDEFQEFLETILNYYLEFFIKN